MPVTNPYAAALATIPVERRTATVLGGETVYWVYGSDDAAETLLLVHGFRGDHHGLEPVIASLPMDRLRVISPDLPGFGESGVLPGREHSIDAFVAWLIAFAEQQNLEGRATVLGHSFGSIVVAAALAADLRAPRTVLVNPIAAPALQGPRGLLTRLAVFYYWASARLPEKLGFALLRSRLIVRVMSAAMAKTRDQDLRRWIHEEHDRYFSRFADRDSLLQAFRASISTDVSRCAGNIGSPVLLVAAERDDITRVSAQRELRERIPEAELIVIPEVGHLIHYETPDTAARAIMQFLNAAPLPDSAGQPLAQEGESASESEASPA